MNTKNHIKADNDSLRGIGKLDWTEGGKMHSTIKKLTSTFEEDDNSFNKGKKEKGICPACKNRVTLVQGKIPRHNRRFTKEICDGKKGFFATAEIVKKIDTVTLNETEFKVGDKAIYTPFSYHVHHFTNSILELTFEAIYLMDNNTVTIKFKEHPNKLPKHYFVKNIIPA